MWGHEGGEVIDAQGAIEEERTPVLDVRTRDFDGMTEVEGVLEEPKVAEAFESIGISPYSFDYRREDDEEIPEKPVWAAFKELATIALAGDNSRDLEEKGTARYVLWFMY